MNIVVCVKQVVDTEAEKRLLAGDWLLDRAGVENILNPYDEYAVEAAMQLVEQHGGEVTILSMGPEAAEEAVRKALAMGADQAVMLTDAILAGSDAGGTAHALAQSLKALEFDLVIFGALSTDAQTGLVPAAVGEALDLPVLAGASLLAVDNGIVTVRRQTDEGYIAYECPLPALVAVTKGINEPRYPSLKGIMGAKKKPLEVVSASDRGVDAAVVGSAGARTRVLDATVVPPRAAGEVIADCGSAEEGARRIADFLAESRLA